MKLSYFFAFAATMFLKDASGNFLGEEGSGLVKEEAEAAIADGFLGDVVKYLSSVLCQFKNLS